MLSLPPWSLPPVFDGREPGSMENWGLIFLNDHDTKAQGKGKKGAEKLVDLLMHELAHQWMGNLVGLPFWAKEGLCCHLEERMGDVVNGRPPRAVGGGKAGGCKSDEAAKASATQDASVLFTGTTYQRSQAFVTDQVRLLGDDAFRDRLRAMVAVHSHEYMSEQTFLDLLAP
eukprot:EG_transcript_14307